MGADTAPQQQTVVEDRQPVAPVKEAQDFSPDKTISWSDIASQCWNNPSSCASAVSKKLGETFGLGSQSEQDLIKQGQLPDLKLIEGGGDTKTDGTDALPRALQGDNKKRTETVMDPKADPKDRLKAASELVSAGIAGFTVQGEDGSISKVRLEKEKVSNDRSMLGVYVTGKNGAEINALRGIEKGDGTIEKQKDGHGRDADYKNRGAALLDRVSENSKVVEDGSVKKAPESAIPKDRKQERQPRRELEPDEKGDKKRELGPDGKELHREKKPGQDGKELPKGDEKSGTGGWKSPYERKYEVGDKFKGITSSYWEDIDTKSGVPFNKNDFTAASREFPFGTVLKVRNPETGKETRVVVTDHGPFAGKMENRPDGSEKVHNRVLDLSLAAATKIGLDKEVKRMEVTVESIPEGAKWGKARQTLSRAGQAELLAQVKRVTREERT